MFIHVRLFAIPRTAARQASLSITNSWSLLKLISIKSVMPSSVVPFPSGLQSFPASESFLCIRWPKYWSVSFSISPSNKYPGLISFRINWLDLLAIQGTLKSLLQHPQFKSISSSALSFLYVQLSHPYMTTGKTIALTRPTFVGKIMSLLFNTLSRLVLGFLSRSKRHFMAAVTICNDFEAQENKVSHCFHCFSIFLP